MTFLVYLYSTKEHYVNSSQNDYILPFSFIFHIQSSRGTCCVTVTLQKIHSAVSIHHVLKISSRQKINDYTCYKNERLYNNPLKTSLVHILHRKAACFNDNNSCFHEFMEATCTTIVGPGTSFDARDIFHRWHVDDGHCLEKTLFQNSSNMRFGFL